VAGLVGGEECVPLWHVGSDVINASINTPVCLRSGTHVSVHVGARFRFHYLHGLEMYIPCGSS